MQINVKSSSALSGAPPSNSKATSKARQVKRKKIRLRRTYSAESRVTGSKVSMFKWNMVMQRMKWPARSVEMPPTSDGKKDKNNRK